MEHCGDAGSDGTAAGRDRRREAGVLFGGGAGVEKTATRKPVKAGGLKILGLSEVAGNLDWG